jgi:predicted amidohydrolase YtcJ
MFAADLVLLNGQVVTLDDRNQRAEAVAVFSGRILATGTTSAMRNLIGRDTQVVDLQGRVVLPGFTDPHVHLADFGTEELYKLDCRDLRPTNVRTLSAVLERIRLHTAECTPGAWIVAHGSPMQDFRMPEGRYPTRQELDAAAPNNPLIINFGAHVSIANSAALASAGVDEATPSPGGGRIERDPTTGQLTGRLYERAQYLVRNPIGHYSTAEKKRGILDAASKCLSRGVTTVHDIVIDAETVRAYQELAEDGLLPIRVSLLIRVIESHLDGRNLIDLGLSTGFGSDWLRLGGVKMSIDGGATGHLSAFSEPYRDDPCNTGLIRIPTKELNETTDVYHRAGHRICMHAMGDVAMDMALDAFDKSITACPRHDHRHRIEHMGNWMVTPERIQTMRRLGIVPVPNLAFGYYLYDSLSAMLGPERMHDSFNLRSMLEAGLRVTSGSDGPYYWAVDALRDIGVAVSRMTRSNDQFSPEQALSVRQALQVMITNGAFAGFDEKSKGRIQRGMLADLVVLAEDIFTVGSDRIKDVEIDITIVDGKVAYFRG